MRRETRQELLNLMREQILKNFKEYMDMLLEELEDIEINGINTKDYPDFADAFLQDATLYGEDVPDSVIDYINDNHSDWVQEQARQQLF